LKSPISIKHYVPSSFINNQCQSIPYQPIYTNAPYQPLYSTIFDIYLNSPVSNLNYIINL